MKNIRILIADDHEMVRLGTRALIERIGGYEICGEAATGREAVDLVENLQPEIVIMDIGMPDLNGLDATRIIKRTHPATEILIFTTNESEELVRSVFRAGAKSYLLKSDAAKHIPLALAALCQHKTYFSTKIAEVVFAGFVQGEKIAESSPLTARERETIQLIAEGKSNKEMAALLGISVATVESHRAALLKKLNLGSIAEVVRYAIGIPRENLVRIFNHGFTTRKNGHGFGLHSGALAAKEMGGALRVESNGPGEGATFTLELPVAGLN